MPNTFTNLKYHIIFGTKNRLPYVTETLEPRLYSYIGGIIAEKRGVLLEINGMPDHVHVLASLRPGIALAEMVQRIKGGSSRWINKQRLCREAFGWQTGYSAFSVSESRIPVLRRYIRRQMQHHRSQTFDQELEKVLRLHGSTSRRGDR